MAVYGAQGCEFQIEVTPASGTYTAVAQLTSLPSLGVTNTTADQQTLDSATAYKIITGSTLSDGSFEVLMDWANTVHQFLITNALATTKTTFNGRLRFVKSGGGFSVVNFTFQVGTAFPTANVGEFQRLPVTITPQSIGTITF